MDNNKIIKKIKGLLAIANDSKSHNDEESQSAFLLAQRLMIEHNINKHDILENTIDAEPIDEESVTIYKKLFWWERQLALIISKNFRVKTFVRSNKTGYHSKRKIVFYGLEKDLELAKEMYLLAYEVILSHSKSYINQYYQEHSILRSKYITESVKTSYINGFLTGLSARFEEQVIQLRNEYEVMVLIPKEVEDAYKDFSKSFGKKLSFSIPDVKSYDSYNKGYKDAKRIDFSRSTIDSDYSSLVGKYIRFSQGITSNLYAKIIKIERENLSLVVMNAVSGARENGKPFDLLSSSFYFWTLPVDYPFEILLPEDDINNFILWYESIKGNSMDSILDNFNFSARTISERMLNYMNSDLLLAEMEAYDYEEIY